MPMSADGIVYLDSSALVKLVVREKESSALLDDLRRQPRRASSSLARVEVPRAVAPHGRRALSRAQAILAQVSLIHLDDTLLDSAAALAPAGLRSLDAVHIASALALGDDLASLITYDVRMTGAATLLGLPVSAPA